MVYTQAQQNQEGQHSRYPEKAINAIDEGEGNEPKPDDNQADQLAGDSSKPTERESKEAPYDPEAEAAGAQLARLPINPEQAALNKALNSGFPPNDPYLRMLYEANNPDKPLSDGQIVRPEDVPEIHPILRDGMTREQFLEAAQHRLPQTVLQELNFHEGEDEDLQGSAKTLKALRNELREKIKDPSVLEMFNQVEQSIKATLESDELKIRDDKDFIDKTTIYMKALMKLAIISAITFGTGGGTLTYISAGASGMFTVYNDIYRKLKEDPQYREANSHLGSMKEEIENMEKLYRSQVAELIKMYQDAPSDEKPNVLAQIKEELGQASGQLLGNLENTKTAARNIPS